MKKLKDLMTGKPSGDRTVGVIPDRGGLGFLVIPPDIDPTMTATKARTWALANPHRGVALGRLLIQYQHSAEELQKQPSLGRDEDRIIKWAVEHPTKARLMVLRLMPVLLKAVK